jgi:signal transduction histidine kinase
VGLAVAGVAAQTALLVGAGVPLLSRAALDRTFPIIPLAAVIGAAVGALIVARHPRHRIGWLLCLGQAGAAVGLAAQTLDAGAGRAIPVASWVGSLLGASYALTLLAALLLLVPDGRLGSRPRRAVLLLVAASYGLRVVALLLNPPTRPAPGPGSAAAAVLGPVADVGTTLGLVAAAGALVVRLRRARGEERQQLRWVVVAAATLAVTLAVMVGVGVARGATAPWYFQAAFYLGYLAVPVATGFAVLRYRLYDVDLVIGSALRLTALAGFVVVGYVTVVVALGEVLGRSRGGVWPSLAAYVLVALAFQPLRRRVDALADRIVYGRRAAPYDSLAAFTRGLAAGPAGPRLLERIARACAEVAGARWAAATVAVPGAPDLTGWWPAAAADGPQLTIPVEHRGEELGRIELAFPPGRSPTRAERRLLGEFAGQAGLAFRNLALTAALQARATALARDGDALAASRRRLLGAADAERSRVAAAIRRDVATGLEALPAALATLAPQIVEDPDGARARLQEFEDATTRAVEALRAITRGVLPPLLARRGLRAALEAYARQSPDRPALLLTGLDERRFPTAVEIAGYSACVDAVRGMRPGAELAVDTVGDRLAVTARGRPTDGASWEHLADRVEALGGRLSVVAAGDATVLQAVVPLGRTDTTGSRPVLEADAVR